MIFIPSLRSKKLTKASKFRNLINMARLDWKLIKFWKFDFVQKSNLIYIECWLILANYHPKSFYYKYMMHTYQKKNGKIALETLFQSSKNRGAQASGNPTSSRFQSFLRCLTHSLASPESIQTLTLHKTIQNHRIRVWFVLENSKIVFHYSCIINMFCCCFCD